MLAKTSLEIGLREKGHFESKGAVRHRLDNIPDRGAALQEDTKTSVRPRRRVWPLAASILAYQLASTRQPLTMTAWP